MLDIIKELSPYPVLFVIFLLYHSFKNWDKIQSILPSIRKDKKRLEDLKSTEFIRDDYLNDFMNSEIEKYDFKLATGLEKNQENEKLIQFYKPISPYLQWNRFRRISKYIKDYDSYDSISDKKVIRKYKFTIFRWSVAFLFVFVLWSGFFFKIPHDISILDKVSIILLLVFLLIIAQWNLTQSVWEYQDLKKYNKVIEKINII